MLSYFVFEEMVYGSFLNLYDLLQKISKETDTLLGTNKAKHVFQGTESSILHQQKADIPITNKL